METSSAADPVVSTPKTRNPPCKVCGGESSGFHYGVDSCEGCKGFFRRCITQGQHNQCANDHKCEITQFSRNSCQACRLRKCQSVGMSRDGSRLGRRPKRLNKGGKVHSSSLVDSGSLSGQDVLNSNESTSSMLLSPSSHLSSNSNETELSHFIEMLQFRHTNRNEVSLQSTNGGIKRRSVDSENFHYTTSGGGDAVSRSRVGYDRDYLCESETSEDSFNSFVPPRRLAVSHSNGTDVMMMSRPTSQHSYDEMMTTANSSPDQRLDSTRARGFDAGLFRSISYQQLNTLQDGRHNDTHVGNEVVKTEVPSYNLPRSHPRYGGGSDLEDMDGNDRMRFHYAGATNSSSAISYKQSGISKHPEFTATVPIGVCLPRPAHCCDNIHNGGNANIDETSEFFVSSSLTSLCKTESIYAVSSSNNHHRGLNNEYHGYTDYRQQRHDGAAQAHPYPGAFVSNMSITETVHNNAVLAETGGVSVTKSDISNGRRNQLHCVRRDRFESLDSCLSARDQLSSNMLLPDSSKVSPPARSAAEREAVSTRTTNVASVAADNCIDGDDTRGIDWLILNGRRKPDESSTAVIRIIIKESIEAHMSTCLYTSSLVAAGLRKYSEMKQEVRIDCESKPDMKVIWQHFLNNMSPTLKRIVKFCKKLPGWVDISLGDKEKLIKQGCFEVVLARYTLLFTDSGLMVPDMTIKVPRESLTLMPMGLGSFFEEQYRFSDIFNALHLTDEEIALLTAIMIICPDRRDLEQEGEIGDLQILFAQALYSWMKTNRPDGYNEKYEETLRLLPQLRIVNERHSEMLNNLQLREGQGDLPPFPPLHVEVFSTDSND